MQITMSSCGNPDFDEDPAQALSPTLIISVATFEEASAACRAYIEQYDLGGGNWSGGQLFEAGRQVARVSYNGRVWEKDGCCLHDPTRAGKYHHHVKGGRAYENRQD